MSTNTQTSDGSWKSFMEGDIQAKQAAVIQFIKQNQFNCAMFVFFLFLAVRSFVQKRKAAEQAGANRQYLDAPDFPDIETVKDFDWRSEEPIKLRNFKPKYHLTMAIQNLNPSELLTFDRTWADRLKYRSKIIREHADIAIGVHDDSRIRPAVVELYKFLFGTYLPKRFPNLFKIHYTMFETGDQFMFENTLTGQLFPTMPKKTTSTETLLKNLGMTIDEDFLFLLPETDAESEDPKYVLQAYVVVGPSGWNPPDKIGKRLAQIHGPVPGYADKLEGSMDKYFKSLEVGKYVKRSNWTITMHEEIFQPDPNANHGHDGEEQQILKEIDPDKTFLRCERQTLHRLPTSGAIVFAFKTYMDSMRDIKLEGLGDELADAIDGMSLGNVPAMSAYKRQTVWGEAVKDFLKS